MKKGTPTVRLRRVFILPSSRNVIIGIAVGLFIGLCVLPFAYIFGLSFIDSAGNFSIKIILFQYGLGFAQSSGAFDS
jgi:hypothetical protein